MIYHSTEWIKINLFCDHSIQKRFYWKASLAVHCIFCCCHLNSVILVGALTNEIITFNKNSI